jgi:hypothetical protein
MSEASWASCRASSMETAKEGIQDAAEGGIARNARGCPLHQQHSA